MIREQLRLGIVGCGVIADEVVRLAEQSLSVEIAAVASRRQPIAKAFAERHKISRCFDSWQELVASNDIDAVYVATPTSVREKVCLEAIDHGKHILAEKPFVNSGSVRLIIDKAASKGVGFMDATHLSHHPRTHVIKAMIADELGSPHALRSSFFTPLDDPGNIRFDPAKEPSGAIGDLAWYCMRAAAEFLNADQTIKHVAGSVVRKTAESAIVRGAGVVVFADNKTLTFDVGYDSNALLMDLDIISDRGVLRLDDFVRDWVHGMYFDHPGYRARVVKHSGNHSPHTLKNILTDSSNATVVLMLDNFADLCRAPASASGARHAELSLCTQRLLDAYIADVCTEAVVGRV